MDIDSSKNSSSIHMSSETPIKWTDNSYYSDLFYGGHVTVPIHIIYSTQYRVNLVYSLCHWANKLNCAHDYSHPLSSKMWDETQTNAS